MRASTTLVTMDGPRMGPPPGGPPPPSGPPPNRMGPPPGGPPPPSGPPPNQMGPPGGPPQDRGPEDRRVRPGTVRRVLPYAARQRMQLLLLVFLAIAGAAVASANPLILKA